MMPGNVKGRPLEQGAASNINSLGTGKDEVTSRVHVGPLSGTPSKTNSTETWWREALRVIDVLAGTRHNFHAQDVLMLVGTPPKGGRRLASAFSHAARRHNLQVVGAALATDGRPLKLWQAVAES